MKNFNLTSPAFVLNIILLAAGTLILASECNPAIGVLFFIPFALGPLLVSLVISALSLPHSSQIVLILGSLLYGGWFSFVFIDAFYWNLDPQSAIALLFIGALSLPVMIPVWALTFWLRHKN